MVGKKLLKNAWDIILGFIVVGFISWIYITNVGPIERVVTEINNTFYDQMLRATLQKLPPIKQSNIAIIAIDDKSIAEQGRWPWSRKKIAQLINQLKSLEAGVIAFDIVFSEPERNIINETLAQINELPKETRPTLQPGFEKLAPIFEYDARFSEALKEGEHILGFVLTAQNETAAGVLPEPLLRFTPEETQATDLPKMQSSLGNIPVLQEAAVHGGFLNSDPDSDGTLRYAFLLLVYQNGVYPSLALEATRNFLLADGIQLVTPSYGDREVLEGIKIDQFVIPTDEMGRMLIPFRGQAYTFPYFSATDILEHRVPASEISGKLLFIGASATGLGDLQPAAVEGNYPGVEIHATIASAILDQYFPSKPAWGRGLEFILILLLGVIAAVVFPFLSAFWLAVISVISIGAWIGITTWLWITKAILFTLIFPLFTILILAFINMVHSYLTASRQRKEIKSIFGQYVPQQHIDTILKSSAESLMSGDSRELSVLFSDIRGFTTMSEKLTASELKAQLS
jgi:adenylate cyclase